MTAGHRPEAQRIDAISADAGEAHALRAENAALRAENAALQAQLTLRDLALDATPTFFIIARQESPAPVIVYCNRSVAQQHGVRREELIGKPITLLTQWVGRNPNYLAEVQDSLRSGQTFHYEDEVIRPDGTAFWLGVSIRPLYDDTGRLTHSVAVGADITAKRIEAHKKQELQDKLLAEMQERERMVIELQLAQKLESVGRLAAGIAHEINTPIQYVGDSVHFLRSAFEDLGNLLDGSSEAAALLPDSEGRTAYRLEVARLIEKYDLQYLRDEVPKAFGRTFDGVERVTNIVKAMKEFAHPDANEQTAVDLLHALETTLLVASNEYKYVAKVRTEFSELPDVVCNVGELNQVFLNLIVNAAHAIKDAGKGVESGEIVISAVRDGAQAVIRVRDNGCGVPAENLGKLYDPFFTTKEVGRGTGQGLAISHSIVVDKHGGEISVASEVGVGTQFTVRLPIAGRGTRPVQ
ncbi:MAG TPA: ATP-binding protein [Steroidobacteraceae bacterium]|jgi:PAS domain S-box-containing protein|nr:ATP-binding protein [Steroidobacteraceae bacterium]